MSKIKNSGLDEYGAESFEQQQFATAGVEGVNLSTVSDNDISRVTVKRDANKSNLRRFSKYLE